jgi:hypothetical protein
MCEPRRGAKRSQAAVDPSPEREAVRVEFCDWCRKPGDDRPAVVGIAAIWQAAYVRVAEMKFCHFWCAFSACVSCVPHTRTDLIAGFQGYFMRQPGATRVYFIPPCPDPNGADMPE